MRHAKIASDRIVFSIVIFSLITSVQSQTAVPPGPRVKVHKKFISVSPADEQDMVSVVGFAGAIESSSAVELKITK